MAAALSKSQTIRCKSVQQRSTGSKNARDNIDSKEVKAFKRLAKELLGYSDAQLKKALKAGSMLEVQ